MKVSLQGFNETIGTFACKNKLRPGAPVKLVGNATVAACEEDETFCGIVVQGEKDYAGVQLGGYAKVKYSGAAPALGFQNLAADYNYGVKTAAAGGGRSYLVIDVDTAASTAGILL